MQQFHDKQLHTMLEYRRRLLSQPGLLQRVEIAGRKQHGLRLPHNHRKRARLHPLHQRQLRKYSASSLQNFHSYAVQMYVPFNLTYYLHLRFNFLILFWYSYYVLQPPVFPYQLQVRYYLRRLHHLLPNRPFLVFMYLRLLLVMLILQKVIRLQGLRFWIILCWKRVPPSHGRFLINTLLPPL